VVMAGEAMTGTGLGWEGERVVLKEVTCKELSYKHIVLGEVRAKRSQNEGRKEGSLRKSENGMKFTSP